jgi:isopropylmalate/homocitrate/citramalate synthase
VFAEGLELMKKDKCAIQDVAKPNLHDEMFPHSRIPPITFEGPLVEIIDGERVEFQPADLKTRDIHLTDTTFRDGQQSRPPYKVEQIVNVYDMMAKLGGKNGVIRQTEFFLYTHRDREAIDKCRNLGHQFPEITGWIRANIGDLRMVKEMGLKETGILTPCSDYHIFLKLRKNRRQAFDEYIRVVEKAVEAGIRPRCHLEDVTRADICGFVIPFACELMRISETLSDELKIKIRLCDTLGFGISYPGAALPRSVPKLIHRMRHDVGVPAKHIEWHGHNDFHKAHVNATTAWLYGADAVNATLFGIGERTGNPPLEGALIEYCGLRGSTNGCDLRMLTRIADYVGNHLFPIAPNHPFVGRECTTTRAGIHADGLLQDERVYNIFDTTNVLNRTPEIAITDRSGVDGVVLWVNRYLQQADGEYVSKLKVHKIARWVSDQYRVHGRSTAISNEELAEQVRIHLPDLVEAAKK